MNKSKLTLIKRLYCLVGDVQCVSLAHNKKTYHQAGEVCPVELEIQLIFNELLK